MKLDDLDNIKVSPSLDKAINSAIEEEIKIRKKNEKRKKYKIVAATVSLALIGGVAIESETVKASINKISSVIKESFGKSNEQLNSVAMINKSVEDNGIKVSINEALIDGNNLIVVTEIDYSNFTHMDWKLEKGKKYSYEDSLTFVNNEKLSASENEKLEKIIFEKIYNGEKINDIKKVEGIDYKKIVGGENYFNNLKQETKKLEAMYEWGTSNEEFYLNDENNKDRLGLYETKAINENGEEEIIQQASIYNNIEAARYTSKINGQEVTAYRYYDYMGDKKNGTRISTNVYDISNIKEDELKFELEIDGFKLDRGYPVRKEGNWNLDFKINKKDAVKQNDLDFTKTIDLKELGNIEIIEAKASEATINLKYHINLKDEYKNKGVKVSLVIKGEKENDTIGSSIMINDSGHGETSIINNINGDSIEIVPYILAPSDMKIPEIEGIKINLK